MGQLEQPVVDGQLWIQFQLRSGGADGAGQAHQPLAAAVAHDLDGAAEGDLAGDALAERDKVADHRVVARA